MTLTTHTAIGSVIGFYIGNPILGFFLGFICHFIIDVIPHGDSRISNAYHVKKKKRLPIAYATVDAIIAVYLLLFVFNFKEHFDQVALSASVAGSVLPDLLIGLYEITKSRFLKWFNKLHFFVHDILIKRFGDIELRYALAYQAVIVIALLQTIS
ncbi:MAG: hypothetical protein WC730_02875 [Patescibacteria group bacterium]|jgi:hypothetical protein